MERNFANNGLKEYGIGSRSSAGKLKEFSWNHISQIHVGLEHQEALGSGGVFSWPPRSYTCSFCKREFRSAQALGGHMNVHRRDRARMRQSSPLVESVGQLAAPTLNLNLCPNIPPSSLSSATSPHSALSSSSPAIVTLCETKHPDGAMILQKNPKIAKSVFLRDESFKAQDGSMFLKKRDIVRLDLEIGIIGDRATEEIDLELRLGCYS